MEYQNPEYLAIYQELSPDSHPGYEMEASSRGLVSNKISDILQTAHANAVDVNVELIRKNMQVTLSNILHIFEMDCYDTSQFSVDEINITLNIDVEGSVSLLSSVSGNVAAKSGVAVRLKRKEKDGE